MSTSIFIPNEIQIEILKFMIFYDFHLISKLSLVCKFFHKTIRTFLDKKEFRQNLIKNFLPLEFQHNNFPQGFDKIFDDSPSLIALKRLFNYVFHQVDNLEYLQYHKMMWNENGSLNNLNCLNPLRNDLIRAEIMIDDEDHAIQFPNEICELTQLYEFYFRSKNLTKLPLEIRQLANLEVLDLERNALTSLPPEIGKLTNLKTLSLCNNLLTSLPPEIGNLINLKKLWLSINKLTVLPIEIHKLKLEQLVCDKIIDISSIELF